MASRQPRHSGESQILVASGRVARIGVLAHGRMPKQARGKVMPLTGLSHWLSKARTDMRQWIVGIIQDLSYNPRQAVYADVLMNA